MVILGYAGAALIGLAITMFIAGLARKPAADSVPGLLTEDQSVAVGSREAELSENLGARLSSPLLGAFTRLGNALRPTDRGQRLAKRFDAAGLNLQPETFYAGKAVAATAGLTLSILVMLILGKLLSLTGVAVLIGVTAAGFFAPDLWLLNTKQQRQQDIRKSLPEALDLLALTVRAGLGLEQGIAEVAGEIEGPLGQELDRVLKEQQLGRTRQDAITALKDRNPDEDLQRLTAALLHADKLGTPISQTLHVQARELRRRRRARAREIAGKAPVKLLLPLIFFIFPAMFVVIMGPGALGIMEALF